MPVNPGICKFKPLFLSLHLRLPPPLNHLTAAAVTDLAAIPPCYPALHLRYCHLQNYLLPQYLYQFTIWFISTIKPVWTHKPLSSINLWCKHLLPSSKHHYYYYFHHPHHNFASAVLSPLCSTPLSPLPLPYFLHLLSSASETMEAFWPSSTYHQWHPTVPPLLCALLLFWLHHSSLKRKRDGPGQ